MMDLREWGRVMDTQNTSIFGPGLQGTTWKGLTVREVRSLGDDPLAHFRPQTLHVIILDTPEGPFSVGYGSDEGMDEECFSWKEGEVSLDMTPEEFIEHFNFSEWELPNEEDNAS